MHRGRQQRDPYAQLGVSRAATPAEINAAYRKLVRALHPDSADTPTEPSALHAVIDAHRILGDPEQRQAHDQSLDTPTPARASRTEPGFTLQPNAGSVTAMDTKRPHAARAAQLASGNSWRAFRPVETWLV